MTYSVHKKLFDGIFCTHTTLYWLIFYLISTRACSSGDLFCTHPSSWWHTLYWGNVLMVYFVHIPPHVDFNSISTSSSYLVCTQGNFTAYFVYLLLDELNFLWLIFYGLHVYIPLGDLFCSYTYILLVTSSVLLELFDGFVFTHISPMLTYFLYLPPVYDQVCTVMTFKVYFVYFLQLGELISRDILRLRDRTSGDLICTHTSS